MLLRTVTSFALLARKPIYHPNFARIIRCKRHTNGRLCAFGCHELVSLTPRRLARLQSFHPLGPGSLRSSQRICMEFLRPRIAITRRVKANRARTRGCVSFSARCSAIRVFFRLARPRFTLRRPPSSFPVNEIACVFLLQGLTVSGCEN